MGTDGYRVPARKKIVGTDGYRVPARKKFLGTDGYREPARKKFLGTDGYRVPGKFSLMPTPGSKFFLILLNLASNFSEMFQKIWIILYQDFIRIFMVWSSSFFTTRNFRAQQISKFDLKIRKNFDTLIIALYIRQLS